MAQNIVNYANNPTGPELLDNYLAKEQENILSSNSGIQRPSYAVPGTLWLDTSVTPWSYNFYDGSDDITIGIFDSTTHIFTVNGVDESNFVHKTGNETIGGTKTFTNSMTTDNIIPQGDITLGTSTNTWGKQLEFRDTAGKRIARIQPMAVTTTNNRVGMWVNNADNTVEKGIYVESNGTTSAPTPTVTTTTSSNQIATTGWVNSRNNNVVHKTGNETISGTKTFQGTGWTLYIKNTNVTYNTAPSSDTTTAIAFVDKNSQNMGVVECFRLADNSTVMQFNIYGRSGAWARRPLGFKINSNGSEVAFAPASDVIDSIVTTTAIRKKTQSGDNASWAVKLGNGFIIQGGSIESNIYTVTLAIPFTKESYQVSMVQADDSEHNINPTLSNKTVTNFKCGHHGWRVSWIAAGF